MPVSYKLTCFGAAHCEACSIANIVKTAFADCKQVLTNNTASLVSQFKVVCELALKYTVKTLNFLLFTKLKTIF